MKIRKKWGCITAMLLLFVVAAVFCLHWAWKYYGLPELPDRREYKTIEERAEKALAFARRHNMNEHYALVRNTTIIRVGLSAAEDRSKYLCDAWAWWGKYGRTSKVQ